MPARPTDFNNSSASASASGSNPTYVIASMPSPSQNPHNTTWGSSSPSHSHHSHHHIHIPTPHPLAAATSFLDKHVPLFAKHHNEFSVNHEARAARREARRSLVVEAIPEVDIEHLPAPPSSNAGGSVIAAAIHAATATGAGPALADTRAADNAAWRDILAKREAARRRAGSEDMQMQGSIVEEGSDEDSSSRGYKGSPAITP